MYMYNYVEVYTGWFSKLIAFVIWQVPSVGNDTVVLTKAYSIVALGEERWSTELENCFYLSE